MPKQFSTSFRLVLQVSYPKYELVQGALAAAAAALLKFSLCEIDSASLVGQYSSRRYEQASRFSWCACIDIIAISMLRHIAVLIHEIQPTLPLHIHFQA